MRTWPRLETLVGRLLPDADVSKRCGRRRVPPATGFEDGNGPGFGLEDLPRGDFEDCDDFERWGDLVRAAADAANARVVALREEVEGESDVPTKSEKLPVSSCSRLANGLREGGTGSALWRADFSDSLCWRGFPGRRTPAVLPIASTMTQSETESKSTRRRELNLTLATQNAG